MKNIIVSACLLGINCTYKGSNSLSIEVLKLLNDYSLIPVCPEQLGGLGTPRPRSEIIGGKGWKNGGKVINSSNHNVTDNFLRGATETLKLARLFDCSVSVLKSESPSCGTEYIYDGTFSDVIVPGMGVTAFLLRKNGIEVLSEKQTNYLTF
ncbi:MAG: DUF523 domain-containing protein [Kosmotogaceae bacterium]